MKRPYNPIADPFNDVTSTEEDRQEARLEKVVKIPINEISDFENHPFPVVFDEDMTMLIDSIKENGLLTPILVRQQNNGNGYELISGHRRKFALLKLGNTEIDAIVRNCNDDDAKIMMVESNLKRENMTLSQKGTVYKMWLESLKSQGKRTDLTSSQNVTMYKKRKRADQTLADRVNENRMTIHRLISLTNLIKPLQEMVDGNHIFFKGKEKLSFKMALLPAVEISNLQICEQEIVVNAIYMTEKTPNFAQAKQLRAASKTLDFTNDFVHKLLATQKANEKDRLHISMEKIKKFFPTSYTNRQMEDEIIKLLEAREKNRQRNSER